MSNQRVVAVVPVRKGSQRVKDKNLRPFAGTTLLDNKLRTLLSVAELDEIIVNTDSEAAIEHVLTKVAMKEQSRQIYRAYVLENRSISEIVAVFGVSVDIVYKVKYRVDKMIEAVEEEYAEEITSARR